MRTIKFRGRVHHALENGGKWVFWYIEGTDMLDAIDPQTIGQFTGLHDRNGVEIYEGDIVRAPHDFGPGGFEDRAFTVWFSPELGYQWEYWLMDQAVVIGNVYEHPERLREAV